MEPRNNKERKLADLYKDWSGKSPDLFEPLPPSGSNRKYYRIGVTTRTIIGVIGEDARENIAFISFSRHFRKKGLTVPDLFKVDPKNGLYLQEDLGDTSLFSLLDHHDKNVSLSVISLYKKSLDMLIRFQVEGGEGLEYSHCYPVKAFDRQSMNWDLNYFKYYYLRPSGIAYDEYALDHDFNKLIEFLEEVDRNYFMYRDFQARNIFIRDGEPWFIDYQGGRKGPLHYDVASLLFQAKAGLPPEFRQSMLDYYLDRLGEKKQVDREHFKTHYYGFVLLRTLQVLGAYGYRGYFEQKPHFLESIRFALENLQWFLYNIRLPLTIKNLYGYLESLTRQSPTEKNTGGFTVDITSFSFLKNGYPKDVSGHGGGFVFDCRSLPNPGRSEKFRALTGKDDAVIRFLEKESDVKSFLDNTFKITGQAVENYLVRRFDHLSINFGCTGGQHRSVYCAEQLYKYLRNNYRINVNITHKMLG